MFSSRFPGSIRKNALTRLLEQKQAGGTNVLDLTESNPTRAGIDFPQAAILHSLARPEALTYQPAPRGLMGARQAVCEYYQTRGQRICPDDLILTSSTSEAYSFLLKLLADPGCNVLTPEPSYPLFDDLCRAESVQARPYRLFFEGGWWVDVQGLRDQIDSQTRALVIVHPNNPTGSFLKMIEAESMRDLCLEHGLALVCDEVFFDYAFATDPMRFDPFSLKEPLSFVLSGFSKVLGLPQLKLSWIVAAGPSPIKQQALERLELVSDTFLSVNTPAQLAAAELLKLKDSIQKQIKARLSQNLNFLRRVFVGSSIEVLPVEGGWCAILRLPNFWSDEEWALRLLRKADTLVHPGYLFSAGPQPLIVISLLTPCRTFQEGIRRLLVLADR